MTDCKVGEDWLDLSSSAKTLTWIMKSHRWYRYCNVQNESVWWHKRTLVKCKWKGREGSVSVGVSSHLTCTSQGPWDMQVLEGMSDAADHLLRRVSYMLPWQWQWQQCTRWWWRKGGWTWWQCRSAPSLSLAGWISSIATAAGGTFSAGLFFISTVFRTFELQVVLAATSHQLVRSLSL